MTYPRNRCVRVNKDICCSADRFGVKFRPLLSSMLPSTILASRRQARPEFLFASADHFGVKIRPLLSSMLSSTILTSHRLAVPEFLFASADRFGVKIRPLRKTLLAVSATGGASRVFPTSNARRSHNPKWQA